MPKSVATYGCGLGHDRGRVRGPLDFINAQRRKASVATESAAGGLQGPLDFLNNTNKPMVADLPQTRNISTAAAVDVLQAAPAATDTAGGKGPLDFLYSQPARKASVATEAAARGEGPVINNANAPATDTAKSRTAPCSAAAAAREDLVEYLASQVGCGAMTVRMMSTLSEKISACLPAGEILPTAGMRERDLHAWCMKQPWRSYLPDLYEFNMEKRVRGPNCDKMCGATHTALLPHELFAQIFAKPRLAEVLLTGGDDNLLKWWADADRCKGPWFDKLRQSAPCSAAAAAGVDAAPAAAAAGVDAAPAAAAACLDTAPAAAVAGYSAMCFDRCVPIGMHGDDAGAHGSDKVTVITWGSAAVVTPTLDSRLVFSMLRESEAPAGSGLDRLMKVFAWSMNALSDGKYPSADQDGRPFDSNHHPGRAALAGTLLASGFRGVWSEFRGDWKFLKEALHLEQHYGANKICHRCTATKHGRDHDLCYTNFSRTAALRNHAINPATFLQSAAAGSNPSPLLKIRDFCISRVFFDIMHCLDLGVLQLAVPSALAELLGCNSAKAEVQLKPSAIFETPGLSFTPLEMRLNNATRHYREWAKSKRHSCGTPFMRNARFTARWVEGAYPQITQLQAKAAELRSMQYWMRDVCVESHSKHEHGSHGKVRAELFEQLVRVDETCRKGGRHLSAAATEVLADAMERALLMYNALAANAYGEGRMLWKTIPKHHALTHVAYDGHGTNPRAVHCYLDEDMVGRTKKIYIKCHGATAPLRGLQRYLILIGLRWHHHNRPRPIHAKLPVKFGKWRLKLRSSGRVVRT
jgi:hypothetical protein